MSTRSSTPSAASRLIRHSDMMSCTVAFIDCRLPGSMPKESYSIIGPGVTQSGDQVINLPEAHGFNIGAAAMPRGITNNLHVHYTAEVFMVFRGEWLFRWGPEGSGGEFVAHAGDVLSMPTWMFRGFTNVGPDDGWIFTALGQDDTGGVIWDPRIIESAAGHGLYLGRDNMLVDTSTGAPAPAEEDRIRPMSAADMGGLRSVSPTEMRARIVTEDDRRWSPRALLDSVVHGHGAELAPVIGFGMSEDRATAPSVVNPHGFTLEWLRVGPGQRVGPFRLKVKQVLIVRSGSVAIALGQDAGDVAFAGQWDVFATPADVWRTLEAGGSGAEIAVVTAGEARARVEWSADIVRDAAAAGWAIDPNGYVAPSRLLPAPAAPRHVALERA